MHRGLKRIIADFFIVDTNHTRTAACRRPYLNMLPLRSHEKFPRPLASEKVLRAPQAPLSLRCCKAARATRLPSSAGLWPSATRTWRTCGARRTLCPQADWELLWEQGGTLLLLAEPYNCTSTSSRTKSATVNIFQDGSLKSRKVNREKRIFTGFTVLKT